MKSSFAVCVLVLAFSATAAFAETIYLKDGTVVHGTIVKVDETSVMIEAGGSWKRIERSTIELIKPGEVKTYPPASAAGQQAPAPEPSRRGQPGAYLGLQVPYSMISGDFDDTTMAKVDPGIGLGIILGYRFNPYIFLEIDAAGSSHQSDFETIGFVELSLNMKLNMLADPDKAIPFLFAGVGSFTIGDNDLMLGGYGYNLGMGFDIPVSANNTIGITVMRKLITYDEIVETSNQATLSGTIKGDATTIRLDLSHHF